MIEYVIKRDGTLEKFDSTKFNKLTRWGIETLVEGESDVDWSSLALEATKELYDRCTTTDIIKALISVCLNKDKEVYFYIAGRLLMSILYKDLYNKEVVPVSLYDHLEKMAELDLYLDFTEEYSFEEIQELENVLDHSKDFKMTHSQVNQMMKKYLVSNKVNNKIYETPQFMFIRVALTVCMYEENRIEKIKTLYRLLSNFHLNLPTPMWTNLGTPHKTGTSCLVYTVKDDVGSLTTGDHISNLMTISGAGIGNVLLTRSKKDSIQNGRLEHLGKIPYYRLLQANIDATMQSGARRGAATTYVVCLDPEIETLIHLRNPTSIPEEKVDGIDYAFSFNKTFVNKVKTNDDWMLISNYYAPDLWEAFYSKDNNTFEELYNLYLNRPEIPKKIVKARDLAITFLTEQLATGRLYEFNSTNANSHTPFKDPIYSSNLCVSGDTLVLHREGSTPISELVGKEVEVWNGEQWSKTVVKQTGTNQSLTKVSVRTKTGSNDWEIKSLICTNYHKWYTVDKAPQRTLNLRLGTELLEWVTPEGDKVTSYIEDLEAVEKGDTYCFTEPLRNMGVFNGILTGNCNEIYLSTKPYNKVTELYEPYKEGAGYVQTCNLAAVNLNKDYTDEEYAELTYWALKIIDHVIDTSHYALPQIGETSKKFKSAGVSFINLAYEMAKNKLLYSSQKGKEHIHSLAERHEYMLMKASLRISKERGTAEWIDKTNYPEGWLPLDTYSKTIDDIVPNNLKYDWETLRKEIIANKGIGHSTLSTFVPSESSSLVSNSTNAIYPVRQAITVKTGSNSKNVFMAPEYDKYKDWYESAWDISAKDITDVYAILQKFCSQGGSWDYYTDHSKEESKSAKKLLIDWLYRDKVGLKGKYYTNNKTVKNNITENSSEDFAGCAGGSCTL